MRFFYFYAILTIFAAPLAAQTTYLHCGRVLTMQGDILGKNRVEIVRFTYRPVRKQREASLRFHLSKREKMDISEAFQLPENQAALRALKQVLR